MASVVVILKLGNTVDFSSLVLVPVSSELRTTCDDFFTRLRPARDLLGQRSWLLLGLRLLHFRFFL